MAVHRDCCIGSVEETEMISSLPDWVFGYESLDHFSLDLHRFSRGKEDTVGKGTNPFDSLCQY